MQLPAIDLLFKMLYQEPITIWAPGYIHLSVKIFLTAH